MLCWLQRAALSVALCVPLSTAFGQVSSYEAARFAEEHQRRVAADDARKDLWIAVAGLAITLITGAKVIARRRQEEQAKDDANEDANEETPGELDQERPVAPAEEIEPEEDLLGPATAPPRTGTDKICPECGAANASTWKVCDECNAPL